MSRAYWSGHACVSVTASTVKSLLSVPLQMLWTSPEAAHKLPPEAPGMSHSLAPLCAAIFRLKIQILTVTVELHTGMQSGSGEC